MLFSGIGFYYRSKGRRFNRKRLLSLPFMRRKKCYEIFYAYYQNILIIISIIT